LGQAPSYFVDTAAGRQDQDDFASTRRNAQIDAPPPQGLSLQANEAELFALASYSASSPAGDDQKRKISVHLLTTLDSKAV
jgi:hypothetical protein